MMSIALSRPAYSYRDDPAVPAFDDSAPVAVMEAMACGLPPICSIIGGTPDMITDGVDGFLVPQEDVAAIAAATRTLATDPDRRAAMGAAARATALRAFDHRVNAQKLYREITGAAAPDHS